MHQLVLLSSILAYLPMLNHTSFSSNKEVCLINLEDVGWLPLVLDSPHYLLSSCFQVNSGNENLLLIVVGEAKNCRGALIIKLVPQLNHSISVRCLGTSLVHLAQLIILLI